MKSKKPVIDRSTHNHTLPVDIDTVDILGVPVNSLDRRTLTRLLGLLPKSRKRGWVSYVNVHAINLAQDLPWFKEYLSHSLLTYCDGEGVRLGSRMLGTPLPERIALSDWIYDVCRLAEQHRWKIFLLGSTASSLQNSERRLKEMFPALKIVGSHNGFFGPEANGQIVSVINRSHPDLLLVGMGMPKQERWILDNFKALKVTLVMNGGSCLDLISGSRQRSPAWMGRVGLEWLFRLVQEPRQLWRRYLLGNPLFLLRIVMARLRGR